MRTAEAFDLRLGELRGLAAGLAGGGYAVAGGAHTLPEWPFLATVRPRAGAKAASRVAMLVAAAFLAPHLMGVGWSVVGRAARPSLLQSTGTAPALNPISSTGADSPAPMTGDSGNYGG